MTEKTNLLGLSRTQLRAFFITLDEKPFRADQVIQWIHQYGITDFSEMSNLSKGLREKLTAVCVVEAPECVSVHQAVDGTRKWLLTVEGGSAVEAVLIPEKQRRTLCVSSQVGCMLDCRFCCTGKQGFNRNLTAHEIIGQLWQVNQTLRREGQDLISNVVMMGMGEPLLNYDAVVPALQIMRDDFAYGLSKRRITLSTSGIVPKLYDLAKDCDVALAISLHAPTDELRDHLVPINRKYNIESLLTACWHYIDNTNHDSVTIEYVMLQGVNDSREQAKALVKLLKPFPVKVNLIPFNSFPNTEYQRSSVDVINAFRDILMTAGIMTFTRKTRGDDIAAACGQLAGQVNDRTFRALRFQKKIALLHK
jgi:23S rRNA (adenine2503-C2)-methyltransferase